MHFEKPSPATLIALLALFVALGGTSYAALKLPRGSVGTAQLKKNAVTSPKVKPGSLLLSDFRASQRSRLHGAPGPQGPQGPQGERGSPGAPGATDVVVRRATVADFAPGTFGPAQVMCNAGEWAVGGGGGFTGNGSSEELMQSFPLNAFGGPALEGDRPVGWRVFLKNENTFTMPAPKAYVVCARP